MVRTSFAEKKRKRKKKSRLKQYVSLRSKGRHNNDEGRTIYGNLENKINSFTGQWKIPFLKITIEADCSIV
jgi:hypothetical protein